MSNKTYKIGILREENDPWIRRAPLTPSDCEFIIKNFNIQIVVQQSEVRCFSDDEYKNLGCSIDEDLSSCDLILGIQPPMINRLIEKKTYAILAKVEKNNLSTEFIDYVLKNRIRLIDYENIKYTTINIPFKFPKNLSFSNLAGFAGVTNILKLLAELLLSRKISTPFVFSRLAHMYSNTEDMVKHFISMGRFLEIQLIAKEVCPFVFGILGNGNAAMGVIEALSNLPHKFISISELLNINSEYKNDIENEEYRNKIFICVFDYKDIYFNNYQEYSDLNMSEEFINNEKNLSDKFIYEDFSLNPNNYNSLFFHYLPYLSCIINCISWKSNFPKILRKNNFQDILLFKKQKLLGICDISCDIDGSIEILNEYCSNSEPYFIYEPITDKKLKNMDLSTKESILYHANPNLSDAFAEEASIQFSSKFKEYAVRICKSYYCPKKLGRKTSNTSEINTFDNEPDLQESVITEHGSITDKFRNLIKTKFLESKSLNLMKFNIIVKLRGHIFDKGAFKKIIDECSKYNVVVNTIFLRVGENDESISVAYLELNSDIVEKLMEFNQLIDKWLSEDVEKQIVFSKLK